MGEIWDVLKPAIPGLITGLIVALVGIEGSIRVARTNQSSARELAGVTANHNLRTQRAIERDKAGRERRGKRIEGLLDQVRTEVEQIIALQNAIESGDAERVRIAMEPLSRRVRRPLAPAIVAIPDAEIRGVFARLSRRLEEAQRIIGEANARGEALTEESFNTGFMLPMLQDLAELDRLIDAYVLGPEP